MNIRQMASGLGMKLEQFGGFTKCIVQIKDN